ncbi:hypothetical protein ABZU76_07965 [Amycolatopsis sp. NPDC005232]|uniref:hypothetical protein n=1 Tax=Amycolatopsis sp. NPDC005232 TaxID=3157027 RepID=UPI0033BAC494
MQNNLRLARRGVLPGAGGVPVLQFRAKTFFLDTVMFSEWGGNALSGEKGQEGSIFPECANLVQGNQFWRASCDSLICAMSSSAAIRSSWFTT